MEFSRKKKIKIFENEVSRAKLNPSKMTLAE
jgi:hypothetical protein